MKKYSKNLLFILFVGFSFSAFAQDINTNLFSKVCDSHNPWFTNCTFNRISLKPFSKVYENELKFRINYDFKNCNFNELNIQFNTNNNYFKISLGNKIIDLIGHNLKITDTYLWDTKTNEYDKSCSLIINSIETFFSDYTKLELNNYISIIKEHKSFVESVNGISPLFRQFSFLISKLNQSNLTSTIDSIIKDISLAKIQHADDEILQFALEGIELEIEIFKQYNPSIENNYKINQFKEKINILLGEIFTSMETKEILKNIEYCKAKVNSILKSADSIPNFNRSELQEYRSQLSTL